MKRYIRAKFEIDESKFDEKQLEEIRKGLEKGLDVSIYADPKFDDYQMYYIRKGLEKGLDVSLYADPKFDWYQMSEIRKGLEGGLDVSLYADPELYWDDMEKIREKLEKKKSRTSGNRKTKWDKLKEQIENDLESGIDPLYEDTEAGSSLNSIVQAVEDKLNIYVEPSVQGGIGGIWIYDKETDETLVEDYNYQSFNEKIIDLCLDSKNKTEFQKGVKSFYEDLIER